MLAGRLDQSALYGVLAEMEALGLVLLEVRRMEPPATSRETGDTTAQGTPGETYVSTANH